MSIFMPPCLLSITNYLEAECLNNSIILEIRDVYDKTTRRVDSTAKTIMFVCLGWNKEGRGIRRRPDKTSELAL